MMDKKVVVVLVVLALILATVSIAYSMFSNSGKEVQSVNAHVIARSGGTGRIGVQIDTPSIENKNG